MNRVSAAIASAIFFILAPGTVAGVLPWLISGWELRPAFLGEWTRMAGAALAAAGLFALVDSFGRFAFQGLGTPAPVLPTKHLVVTGLYRHVRNPMYVAVVALVLGRALLLSDWRLLACAAAVWLGFQAFVTMYEEPTLREMFGEDYEVYCRGVRRWWPRLSPWRPLS